MAFNVNSFRANGLKYDGARPTLFEIRVNFPALASTGTAESSRLRFLAQAASLPETTIDQIPIPYFGRVIKVEGNRTFSDWTVTVLNDEDFSVKAAFEAWMNGMNTHISNKKNPEFAGLNYKSTATVYQLSKELEGNDVESAIRAYTFSGLFPVSVSPINLDWSATNTVETFTVTFAYDYWVPGADENYADGGASYNGVDGSAKAWNPKLPSDNE
jgi:T4-like virus tail tube protein gp19